MEELYRVVRTFGIDGKPSICMSYALLTCPSVHYARRHVLYTNFSKTIKVQGSKRTWDPKGWSHDKAPRPGSFLNCCQALVESGLEVPGRRWAWSSVPYVGHLSHPGIWDGPGFRANRDLLKPCGDTPRCLGTNLPLLWCWLLRTHCCPFPEKRPWDNDSFLAQKVTHTHKAGRGWFLSTRKGQTPCPQWDQLWCGSDSHSSAPRGSSRSQSPAKTTSLLGPSPCLVLLPSLPLRWQCSLNKPLSHESPLRLCLRNPSSFHGSLCPYSISHIDSQTPPRLAGTLTIFRPSRWLEQPPSLYPLPCSGIIINIHQTQE